MDTIEVTNDYVRYKAFRVFRDGKFLYAYDYWYGDFKVVGSQGADIACFKRKI